VDHNAVGASPAIVVTESEGLWWILASSDLSHETSSDGKPSVNCPREGYEAPPSMHGGIADQPGTDMRRGKGMSGV
jgi:hypothetical protein